MWTVAMCFLFSIVFELVSQNFFGSKSTEAETGQREPKLGERRNTDVGHKRYYDEEELDVGLGLVKEGEKEGESMIGKKKMNSKLTR